MAKRQRKRASVLNAWPAPFDHPFYPVMNAAVGGCGPTQPRGPGKLPWHQKT